MSQAGGPGLSQPCLARAVEPLSVSPATDCSSTPLPLLSVAWLKKAVKIAAHEVRKRQNDLVTVLQQDLESVRTVKALGRQGTAEERLDTASMESVKAALKARR
jgi:ABC-type multidrug transport system fused ATPase/permease subunit